MDESSLFPGFGRPDDNDRTEKRARKKRATGKNQERNREASVHTAPGAAHEAPAAAHVAPAAAPVAPRSPDDCVPPARFVPAALLDHTHLVAPTLDHLEECQALGMTATAVVEECLRQRRRFPHTLLVGPADSSKRTIARTIAAEMAVPFHSLEFMQLRGPRGLHAALSRVTPGAVVLVSGLESACVEAIADITRAVQDRRPPARPRSFESTLRNLDREPWKRAARRTPEPYADFTMIISSREHVPSASPFHRWAELQFFLQRNVDTESARLHRLFRHAGIAFDAATIAEIAAVAVGSRIRTLQVANLLATFVRRVGLAPDAMVAELVRPTSGKEHSLRQMLEVLLAESKDPGPGEKSVPL